LNFFFFFSFVMADSPSIPPSTENNNHHYYNMTGVIPSAVESSSSPLAIAAEPVMPSPPTTVRLLSPSALTPNTVRDVRNFQPTPAARITASVRKAASMAATAPATPQADSTAILSTAAILAHAAVAADDTGAAAECDDGAVAATATTAALFVAPAAVDETTLSFYELQRREVAQRRELATAKKAQAQAAQRRRADAAVAAEEPKAIAASLSMSAAPPANGDGKVGIVRRHSTLTRQLPPVPRVARPKPAATAAPTRGRARTQVEEAVSAAMNEVQAQYQLSALPDFFVQQVEVAADGQTAKYTVAGHTYNVLMRGRKCMVRTGGGWVAVATFMAEALERAHESLVTAANPALETKRARSRSRSRSRSRRAQPQPLEEGAFGAYSEPAAADHADADDEIYVVTHQAMPVPAAEQQSAVSAAIEAPLAAKRLSVAPTRAPAPAPISMPNTKWRLDVPPPMTHADLASAQERKRFQLDAFPAPFQTGDAAEQLALVYDCFFVEDGGNNGTNTDDDDVHLALDELRTKLPDFSEEKLEIFLELLESRHLLKAIAIEYGDGEAQLAWQRIGL
jgi:hypothetical protein